MTRLMAPGSNLSNHSVCTMSPPLMCLYEGCVSARTQYDTTRLTIHHDTTIFLGFSTLSDSIGLWMNPVTRDWEIRCSGDSVGFTATHFRPIRAGVYDGVQTALVWWFSRNEPPCSVHAGAGQCVYHHHASLCSSKWVVWRPLSLLL